MINAEKLRRALLNLDMVRVKANTFDTHWLDESSSTREQYEQLRTSLETQMPGFEVHYADLGDRQGHVLIPGKCKEVNANA